MWARNFSIPAQVDALLHALMMLWRIGPVAHVSRRIRFGPSFLGVVVEVLGFRLGLFDVGLGGLAFQHMAALLHALHDAVAD